MEKILTYAAKIFQGISGHAQKTDCTSAALRSIIGMSFKLLDT